MAKLEVADIFGLAKEDPISEQFTAAHYHLRLAEDDLAELVKLYQVSNHPNKAARIRSITSKIKALRDLCVDPQAYPWSNDRS